MMKRILTMLLMLGYVSVFADDATLQKIEQRIKPVGQVHLAGAVAATPVVAAPPVTPTVRTGQAVYDQFCTVCHQGGLAGAPKFRDATDWGPRVSAKKLDGLVASALKGLNAMPAKGTCQDCTDAEIKAAISYMLPQ